MRRASKISKSVFFKFDVITLEHGVEHGVSSFADDNLHGWAVSFEIDMEQKTVSFIRNFGQSGTQETKTAKGF